MVINKAILKAIVFLLYFSLKSICSYSQRLSEDDNNDVLSKVLRKNIVYPGYLVDKKQSSFFTLRFEFGKDSKLVNITASKYAPKEVLKTGIDPENYKTVNWQVVLKKKPEDGDIVIIPISIYSSSDQNTVFYEYTLEDAFNYNGVIANPIKCLVLQPIVMKFGPAKK